MSSEAPLPSASEASEEAPAPAAAPAAGRPPAPTFKFSTFILTFLFFIGILMLFDTNTRNGVASALNAGLYPLIGFGDRYLLATMFLAAVLEMLLTAVAYNYTTDWIKAAKVQSWGAAFRKVQMAALRSGKKDRIAALQPHQQQLTRLSGEVSIAQLKGMAVTWFLVIAIYTWVGIQIGGTPGAKVGDLVNLGGVLASLAGHVGSLPIPLWFLIFSLYTVPFSLVFRRVLKHYWLKRHESRLPAPSGEAQGSLGTM